VQVGGFGDDAIDIRRTRTIHANPGDAIRRNVLFFDEVLDAQDDLFDSRLRPQMREGGNFNPLLGDWIAGVVEAIDADLRAADVDADEDLLVGFVRHEYRAFRDMKLSIQSTP